MLIGLVTRKAYDRLGGKDLIGELRTRCNVSLYFIISSNNWFFLVKWAVIIPDEEFLNINIFIDSYLLIDNHRVKNDIRQYRDIIYLAINISKDGLICLSGYTKRKRG